MTLLSPKMSYILMKIINHNFLLIFHVFQRPPSSSLSYGGAVNDDVRSPGSGGTPGPLSAQPPPGLDSSDPGKSQFAIHFIQLHANLTSNQNESFRLWNWEEFSDLTQTCDAQRLAAAFSSSSFELKNTN